MKKTRYMILAALLCALVPVWGCQKRPSEDTNVGLGAAETSGAGSGTEGVQDESGSTGQVASKEEMASPEEVSGEGLVSVRSEELEDGIYDISVDSSSRMFRITKCSLTVKDGEMTAAMTMGGTGYLYVYMGTGSEAAEAPKEELTAFTENEDGTHSFEVPVKALNEEVSCAAFSKKKEKWYERTLVFRADGLPEEAYKEGAFTTAKSLGLEDGEYTVEVSLSGGSGRASVESPAQLRVKDGEAYARIVWGSSNYDYMKVDGVQYDPVNTEGNSAFEIPVAGFDCQMPVIADTVAMSAPHEISYTLYFDSGSVSK